jgi:STAS domain
MKAELPPKGGSHTEGTSAFRRKLHRYIGLLIYKQLNSLPEIVILRLRNMTALDATGLLAFEELALGTQQSGRCLILCGARHQPGRLIARADFHRHVGDSKICAHLHDALERGGPIHEVHWCSARQRRRLRGRLHSVEPRSVRPPRYAASGKSGCIGPHGSG